jgi:hypothetical protein
MHTCIHAYMHTYIHAYMHTCIHQYDSIRTFIRTYIHTNIRVHLHIFIYIYTCTFTFTFTYTYADTYTYMHACMHRIIYTYNGDRPSQNPTWCVKLLTAFAGIRNVLEPSGCDLPRGPVVLRCWTHRWELAELGKHDCSYRLVACLLTLLLSSRYKE